MCFRLRSLLFVIVASINCPAAVSQDLQTHNVICDDVVFTLPLGMTVKKVAGNPLIKWPIVADWDSRGRLVVAESGGVGWSIQEHNEQ